jgi:hypothetical protein
MNRLDSHFNDFGGIDSRTNQMVQKPKTARDGRNFEYRTDGALNDFDVLAKRRGFQHKAIGSQAAAGLVQYIYRDLNTGAQKVEVLGVGSDGILRKRVEVSITLTKAGGVVTSYSLFYDETVSLWRISFYDNAQGQVATYTFDSTLSLSDLATALNTLAITGLTASSTSSEKAYLLDVSWYKEIESGANVLTAFEWQVIPTPHNGALFDYVASGAYLTNPEWAGISYVNLNNSIYITDGGFPIKYDGFSAYRAGSPAIKLWHPVYDTTMYKIQGGGSTAWTLGSYHLRAQVRYKDPNGVTHYGSMQALENAAFFVTDISSPSQIFNIRRIAQENKFPVYACKISGAQSLSGSGAWTINVASGHNVRIGMALRVCAITSNFLNGTVYYLRVTDATATTLTLSNNGSGLTFSSLPLADGQVINACYVPEDVFGTLDRNVGYSTSALTPMPVDVYGISLVFVMTKVDAGQFSPYYEFCFFDIPAIQADEYSRNVRGINSNLALFNTIYDEESNAGTELPRACRYLSQWQGQMVQAGRPYNTALADAYYPTVYDPVQVIVDYGYDLMVRNFIFYTEASLCDFQSIYWNDPIYPEGFPQSGLTEESFETLFADQVTGMGESKDSFFVFKDRSMFLLNGELATGDIRKEKYEVDIGCASHNSIVSVKGGLIWLDKTHGFCAAIANQLPRTIGYNVQDWQKINLFKNSNERLVYPNSRAINDLFGDKYICYVPRASGSLTFVFDYADNRNCWYIWDGVDASGGFIYDNDTVVYSSASHLWSQKRTSSKYDFSDHVNAIALVFKSAWINFNTQSVDKKWVQVVIQSARRGFEILVSQYYNYIDTKEGEIALAFNEGSTVSPKRTVALNKLKSLAFSLGMENSVINQDVSVNGWELQYSSEYDVGEAKR